MLMKFINKIFIISLDDINVVLMGNVGNINISLRSIFSTFIKYTMEL